MDYLQQYSLFQQQRNLLEAHHSLQAAASVAASPSELSLGVNGKPQDNAYFLVSFKIPIELL